MSKILLAKPKLSDGWIDTSVGEAHIVRDALFKAFDNFTLHMVDLATKHKSEYQDPAGFPPLVKFLEDKYQAPVVITNGAKQALSASFYVLQKLGKRKLGLHCPWWCLLPPLIEANGLEPICANDNTNYDAYLAVLPGNPDGHMFDLDHVKKLATQHREFNIPFIHDAVYYSPVYLPQQKTFPAFGDVQIFSASKSWGLSGLRAGYCVCYNHDYYHPIQSYVEMMTVGVSTASQEIVHKLLLDLKAYPDKESAFIRECQNKLYIAKSIIKNVRPDVLEVPIDITDTPGMFLFARAPKPEVFEKAKVNVAHGAAFGKEGYVRINLAVPTETLIEVVKRLNDVPTN
jgi:aspartate/methionine/tyrosine aminotransferase